MREFEFVLGGVPAVIGDADLQGSYYPVPGPQGPQGIPGVPGAIGPAGPQGPQGEPGGVNEPDVDEDGTLVFVPVAAYMTADAVALPAGAQPTAEYDYLTNELTLGIPAGATGAQGIQGVPGADGADGADGVDGEDGVSPTVTVTTITGGHRITITDASGAHSFDVMDGEGSSEHIYNVKDYGAKGDGATDDYDAIMAAVADAKAHSGVYGTRATVYFPAGRYYVRWGIGLDETAAPISITGESSASVTITGSVSGPLLGLHRTDSGMSYGSTISGLTLQTNSSATNGLYIEQQGQCVIEDVVIYNSHGAATGYGLTVDHSSQVFFSHIQVQGFDTGCYIDNPAGYGDVYFSDCRFDGNSTNGFEAYRVSGLYLSNVTMYGNGVTGLVLGHQISGVVSYPFAENVFPNNVVADTSGLMNGALVWADNVMMSNCWFATQMNSPASSANHGLYIENSSNITITASTFRNNFDNGIYATNSNYISINGCIFRKNGQRSAYTYAVALVACTKITVCGNVFMPDSYQKRGVYIDGCDFFIVANNSLDNTDVPVYSNEPTSTTRIIKDNIS